MVLLSYRLIMFVSGVAHARMESYLLVLFDYGRKEKLLCQT